MSDDRSRLDALRAWAISDPPATYLLDDVRWAIREIERHRPDLSVLTAESCPCCNGDPDTVCSACGEHSCWAGVMYCEDYKTAGTRQKSLGGAS